MKCEPVETAHLDENIDENKLIHYNEKKNNTQDNSNSTEVKELLEIIKTQQKQLNQSHKLIDKVIKETVPRIGNNNNNISINVYLTIFTAVGVILGASYMLLLYKNINFGDIKSEIKNLTDLSRIELFYFSLLATLTIFLGVYPKILFQMIDQSINIGILS